MTSADAAAEHGAGDGFQVAVRCIGQAATPVTGVDADVFTLFVGNLTGGPGITNVTGAATSWTVTASTGSGDGTLALYVTDTQNVTDASGNPLSALPVIGPGYAIDHTAPAVNQVTTNIATINDAAAGPAGFSVNAKFSETMDQSATLRAAHLRPVRWSRARHAAAPQAVQDLAQFVRPVIASRETHPGGAPPCRC